jgi:hypothetical protein
VIVDSTRNGKYEGQQPTEEIMLLQVQEQAQTRRYLLDETALYHKLLPASEVDLPSETRGYRTYYPQHPYNQYLWNEHLQAMVSLREHLSMANTLDKAILWRASAPVSGFDPAETNWFRAYSTFVKLRDTRVPGFRCRELNLWVETSKGSVAYVVGWHELEDVEKFLSAYPELVTMQSPTASAPETKAIPKDWFETELAVVERQQQKQPKKEEETNMRSPAPEVNRYYRHYKGKIVRVLHLGIQEATGVDVVVHEVLGTGKIWVRPVSEWTEYVKRDGLQVPRFEKIELVDFLRQEVQNGK